MLAFCLSPTEVKPVRGRMDDGQKKPAEAGFFTVSRHQNAAQTV